MSDHTPESRERGAEPIDLNHIERRDETPGQRYLRLARTDPELLDRLAANTWAHVRNLPHLHPANRWKDVPEEERRAWRERVLADLERDAEPDLRSVRYRLGASEYEAGAYGVQQMHLSLRNCYTLARRMKRRLEMIGDDTAAWGHIIRFCEEAGIAPEILR